MTLRGLVRMNHDEQLAILYELFDPSLPRLGPGDRCSTRKALDMLLAAGLRPTGGSGSGRLRILDIGCGNGSHTIELACCLDGAITAVDNHSPYLDELQRRAVMNGVANKVRPLLRDMADMRLSEGDFDLIWSEGALYNVGFRKGIEICHSLLAKGGSLAASELCWLRPDAPTECHQFFADEYPAMENVQGNLAIISESGFRVVGHFTLPDSAWTESYYRPLSLRLASLRKKYEAVPRVLKLLDSVQTEMDVFSKYSTYYGYVFFLMIHNRS